MARRRCINLAGLLDKSETRVRQARDGIKGSSISHEAWILWYLNVRTSPLLAGGA